MVLRGWDPVHDGRDWDNEDGEWIHDPFDIDDEWEPQSRVRR